MIIGQECSKDKNEFLKGENVRKRHDKLSDNTNA